MTLISRIKIITVLCILVAVPCLADCPSQNCYVTTTGSGSTCTAGSPCSLTTAQGLAIAGDTINIGVGTWAENVTISTSGTSGNPITYKGAGNTTYFARYVTVSANYIVMDGFRVGHPTRLRDSGTSTSMVVTGSNNAFKNFLHDPDNIPEGVYGIGVISIEGSASYNTVENFEARETDWASMFLLGSSTSHNTIQNGTVHDVYDVDVFRPMGTYQTIKNIEVYGGICYEWPEQHMDFFQIVGDSAGTTHDIVFENNYVHDLDANIGFTSEDTNTNTYGLTFRNNIFKNVAGELRIGIQNVKIYNNIFDTVGTGSTCGIDDYVGVINVGGSTSVFNNTGLEIKNNLFILSIRPQSVYSGGGPQAVTWANNAYLTLTYTANDYYRDAGGDSVQITDVGKVTSGDPLLTNPSSGDFTISSAESPLVNAGTTIATFDVDRLGASRPNGVAWDIGPYEYEASGGDSTDPTLAEVTPVTASSTNQSPSYVFSTDEACTVTYGGTCGTGTLLSATIGNNTTNWNLAVGTYSNCTITCTDYSSNASTPLAVTSFAIIPVAGMPKAAGGGMSFSGSLP